jgi:hypothetical protein
MAIPPLVSSAAAKSLFAFDMLLPLIIVNDFEMSPHGSL